MRSSRGELYDHGNANMILHYRMNLHTAFLLTTLRMSAYALEDVIKKVIVVESIIYRSFFHVFCLPFAGLSDKMCTFAHVIEV